MFTGQTDAAKRVHDRSYDGSAVPVPQSICDTHGSNRWPPPSGGDGTQHADGKRLLPTARE